jgi:hypothetical protein
MILMALGIVAVLATARVMSSRAPLARPKGDEWLVPGAFAAIILVSWAEMGRDCLVLLVPFCSFSLFLLITTPRGRLRALLCGASVAGVIALAFYLNRLTSSYRWQWGPRTIMNTASLMNARGAARYAEKRLRELSITDQTDNPRGPLLSSQLWKQYGHQDYYLSHLAREWEYLPVFRGQPVWHSAITQLFRVVNDRGVLHVDTKSDSGEVIVYLIIKPNSGS